MPSAGDVVVTAVDAVTFDDKAVMGVACGAEQRIVAAALLADIVQRQLMESVAAIGVIADIESYDIEHVAIAVFHCQHIVSGCCD